MNRVAPLSRSLSCRSSTSQTRLNSLFYTRKLASSSAAPKTTKRSPYVALGLAGGAVVVSAYFLWPDVSRAAPTYEGGSLSPSHFTPVKVLASEQCSHPDYRLITLGLPKQSFPTPEQLPPIWSIFIKDDDIQVERPYTPLDGIDSEGQMKFWIKKYPKGEVGRWLHSKNVGDTIEIRGPVKTWPWKNEAWDEVVMISGGTGITPFYQLLRETLLSSHHPTKTRFTLLHSSRTLRELPPLEILQPLFDHAQKHPEQLKIALFVDSVEDPSPKSDIRVCRISKPEIVRALGLERSQSWWQRLLNAPSISPLGDRKVLVLVCGPDPMVAAIAGPFGRNMSQGPVRGILGELGLSKEQVWKL